MFPFQQNRRQKISPEERISEYQSKRNTKCLLVAASTVFLSLHASNSKTQPEGLGVIDAKDSG